MGVDRHSHGDVTRHLFATHIGLHYPDNQTAYVVYTPPGYNAKRRGGYPVLYLLHGFSDTEDGWTLTGRANLMLDRMLADGKIVPMIVVMPRGYGDFDVILALHRGDDLVSQGLAEERNIAIVHSGGGCASGALRPHDGR